MGRRSEMGTLVRGIEASEQARERLKVILLTLSGQWSVAEGCERLGVGRTRFQDLRRALLSAGARALESGIVGRPRRTRRRSRERHALEAEVSTLERELRHVHAEVLIYDCKLGTVPRVREALRSARRAPGRSVR